MTTTHKLKAAINMVVGILGYEPYFSDIKGIESCKITGLNDLTFNNREEKLLHLIDTFIYPHTKQINELFLSSLKRSIKNNARVYRKFELITGFATSKDIPVIKFPSIKIGNSIYIGSHCMTDSRNTRKSFIRYVDSVNPTLYYAKLSKQNIMINFYAHELGHALDFDSELLIKVTDDTFKYQREVNAWNIAYDILNELGLRNEEFQIQKELALERYYKHFKIND